MLTGCFTPHFRWVSLHVARELLFLARRECIVESHNIVWDSLDYGNFQLLIAKGVVLLYFWLVTLAKLPLVGLIGVLLYHSS
jgi:hypothetical protein